jgi:hypothetical protein
MFVQGSNVEIQRNDLLQENAFKIKATGKAFKILSDGLYADKIKAVIRELSCNAFDAHVAAKTTGVPFEVHLPNLVEPHFTVRDYGIGLSKEACQELFTTYFESTKTTSNDFIGALGLGSKSPFSYVDAFTVISRFNGIKYTFSAFIGEDEMPKIALMGEETTTEGNGLEVSMPVRRNDFSVFSDRAMTVLKRFDPMPTITGNVINLQVEEPVMQGSCWQLMKGMNHYGYSNKGAVAIQGKIEYPLNVDALHDSLTRAQLTLLRYPFELDFDIGDLEIAASREALGYKQPTINAIANKLDVLIAELPKEFQTKFDNVRTIWEAHIEFASLFNGNTSMSYMLRELNSSKALTFTALGKQIDSSKVKVKYADYPSIVVQEFHSYGRPSTTTFKAAGEAAKNNSRHNSEYFSIEAGNHCLFFTNDLKVGAATRVSRFTKQRNSTTSFLVSGDEADIEKFFKDLGEPPVHATSELPKPVKSQSTKVKARSYSLKDRRWSVDNDIDLNDDEPGLFLYYARWTSHVDIKSTCGTLTERVRSLGDYEFGNFVQMLVDYNVIDKDTRIVGLNKITFDKLTKNEDTEWENFGHAVSDAFVKTCLSNQTYMDEVADMSAADQVRADYYVTQMVDRFKEQRGKLDVASPIHAFIDKIETVKKVDSSKVRRFLQLVDNMGHTLQSSNKEFNYTDDLEALKSRYEMVTVCEPYYWARHMDKIVNYVNQIEMLHRAQKG